MLEEQVLAHFLQNPTDYPYHRAALLSVEWSSTLDVSVAEAIHKSWDESGLLPKNPDQLVWCVASIDAPKEVLDLITVPGVADKFYEPIDDIDQKRIGQFLWSKARKSLAEEVESVDLQSLTELTKVRGKIDKHIEIYSGNDDMWDMPFSEECLQNPYQDMQKSRGEAISSKSPVMDRILEGGFYESEQVLFIGLPGHGKSLVKAHFSVQAAMQGKRGIYYAFDNSKAEMVRRLYANVAQIHVSLRDGEEAYNAAVRGISGKIQRDHFLLRKWPRGTKSVDDIARDLNRARDHFRRIDLERGIAPEEAGRIFWFTVDYGDVVAPSAACARMDKRHQLDDIFMRCAGLAEEHRAVNFISTQSNQEGMKLTTINMNNAAEAFAKNRHASLVITINQPPADFVRNLMWLAFVKARREETQLKIPFEMDRTTMSLKDYYGKDVVYLSDEAESGGKRTRKNKPGTEFPKEEMTEKSGMSGPRVRISNKEFAPRNQKEASAVDRG